MKLKYLIFDLDGLELPLVFPAYLSHGDVMIFRGINAKSAGYCEINTMGNWTVSGQSVTLRLDARPEDAGILNSQFSRKEKQSFH